MKHNELYGKESLMSSVLPANISQVRKKGFALTNALAYLCWSNYDITALLSVC
jgi:hypothetical protein